MAEAQSPAELEGVHPGSVDLSEVASAFTPGPWEYVPSNDHHGAYVTGNYGGDICDCYAMSDPSSPSVRNGGKSKPIPFQNHDANARLIAAAPELLSALTALHDTLEAIRVDQSSDNIFGGKSNPEKRANSAQYAHFIAENADKLDGLLEAAWRAVTKATQIEAVAK